MEFRVLKYFLTIAQEENMTRAAAILHLTQPTLSRQIMMLEDELGVQLFVRGRYNMTLTPEGEFLKKRAEEIIALSESTQRDIMKGEATLGGTISIGCAETSSMFFLSRLMASFRQLIPASHDDGQE